jgi:hypothetical protein
MRKTRNALMVLVLVVILPFTGRSQTVMICFEDTQQKNYFLCMSEQDINDILTYGKIEWCKTENTENQKIKKCLLTSNNHSFSEIVLFSEPLEDSSTRIQCIRIEVCCYNNRTLYIKKGSEKLWWRATNILNCKEAEIDNLQTITQSAE